MNRTLEIKKRTELKSRLVQHAIYKQQKGPVEEQRLKVRVLLRRRLGKRSRKVSLIVVRLRTTWYRDEAEDS